MSKYYVPGILWGAMIFVLCMLPGKSLPRWDWTDIFSFDKFVHFTLFGILTGLLLRGYLKKEGTMTIYTFTKTAFLVATLCGCYGWFTELCQAWFTYDRKFEILDGIADMTGAFAAMYVAVRYIKKRKWIYNPS